MSKDHQKGRSRQEGEIQACFVFVFVLLIRVKEALKKEEDKIKLL